MKIHVDREACQGHAACAAYAPELYTLDELGYSSIEVLEVPPGMEGIARRGAAACPEMVITIEE